MNIDRDIKYPVAGGAGNISILFLKLFIKTVIQKQIRGQHVYC